jgi:hypothetical protein
VKNVDIMMAGKMTVSLEAFRFPAKRGMRRGGCRLVPYLLRSGGIAKLAKPTDCYDRECRAAGIKETWTDRMERMQRDTLDRAVSAVNGMLSSLEGQKLQDELKNAAVSEMVSDAARIEAPTLPSGETLQLNMKAKTSVLRPVKVPLGQS